MIDVTDSLIIVNANIDQNVELLWVSLDFQTLEVRDRQLEFQKMKKFCALGFQVPRSLSELNDVVRSYWENIV